MTGAWHRKAPTQEAIEHHYVRCRAPSLRRLAIFLNELAIGVCYLALMIRFARGIFMCFGFLSCLTVAHAQHMNSSEAPCRNVAITVDVVNCFGESGKVADSKLNQTYVQILSVLQADDKQKLRVAQRLWLQFRDATCIAERKLYEGGTAASPAYLACIEEETRQRTNDLRTTYGWVVEKFSK